jgi:hypothetical protein
MAARGRRIAPYRAAVRAAAEPEPVEPGPAAPSRWLKPLSTYNRRESSEVHGRRYG